MKRIQAIRRPIKKFTLPSMTDQSQAKECDVNNIMKKYLKTGQITHLSSKQAIYADISQIPDLLEATIKVKEASEAFRALPASLREKLNNDPSQLPSYLSDPKNDEEAISYGLKVKRPNAHKNDELNDEKKSKKAQKPKEPVTEE